MKTIIFANNKGGTGKTTSAVAVAWYLSVLYPGRVLLIDLDDQGNSTETTGSRRDHAGVSEFLLAKTTATDAFRATYVQTVQDQLDVLGASYWFGEHQDELSTGKSHQFKLRDKLRPLASLYDFVVIDCPPALNDMNYRAFVAADQFVVVAEPAPLAKKGIDRLMEISQELRKEENPGLQCAGILFTAYNPKERGRVRQQVYEVTYEDYGNELKLPPIRRDIAVEESQAFDQPLPLYAPASRAAVDYAELTTALLVRLDVLTAAQAAKAVMAKILNNNTK